MRTRDVVIGLVILALVITGVLIYKNSKKGTSPKVTSPTPSYGQVESKFPSLKVSQNADRANLTASLGVQGMGEAFRTYENGEFSITVIADLSVPESGKFYQAWIVKDNMFFSLGKMNIAKGGYISEFSSPKDYSEYTKVIVTEEKIFDSTPETNILVGSF